MNGLDVYQQSVVADAFIHPGLTGLIRIFTTPVLEVAAGANAQYLARQCNRTMGLVPGNPDLPHSDSRAKYAVDFPRNTLGMSKPCIRIRLHVGAGL